MYSAVPNPLLVYYWSFTKVTVADHFQSSASGRCWRSSRSRHAQPCVLSRGTLIPNHVPTCSTHLCPILFPNALDMPRTVILYQLVFASITDGDDGSKVDFNPSKKKIIDPSGGTDHDHRNSRRTKEDEMSLRDFRTERRNGDSTIKGHHHAGLIPATRVSSRRQRCPTVCDACHIQSLGGRQASSRTVSLADLQRR